VSATAKHLYDLRCSDIFPRVAPCYRQSSARTYDVSENCSKFQVVPHAIACIVWLCVLKQRNSEILGKDEHTCCDLCSLRHQVVPKTVDIWGKSCEKILWKMNLTRHGLKNAYGLLYVIVRVFSFIQNWLTCSLTFPPCRSLSLGDLLLAVQATVQRTWLLASRSPIFPSTLDVHSLHAWLFS
jgi:hypothetical protein